MLEHPEHISGNASANMALMEVDRACALQALVWLCHVTVNQGHLVLESLSGGGGGGEGGHTQVIMQVTRSIVMTHE